MPLGERPVTLEEIAGGSRAGLGSHPGILRFYYHGCLMPSSRLLPTVVIVGRPNVGKSTLFNRITGKRRSIVGDEPGITRDRIEGLAEYKGRKFELIDTGGVVFHDEDYIPSQILKQARFALSKANHIIFLIDGRTEITSAD